jgi:2-polyprenyl-3-methyl-5-hydroxy-6-metoxy-1,4-benzoquinol methylase
MKLITPPPPPTPSLSDTYDNRTINSSNPFVGFAHRSRYKKMIKYLTPRLELGKVLDYGCGTGVLISELNNIKPDCCVGYEPFFTTEYCKDNLPIYSDYNDIQKNAPYKTITICEVMEHLQWTELAKILLRFDEILSPDGAIVVSVPIEIGPVILLKELHRSKYEKKWTYRFFEFLGALIFGITGYRENPDDSYMPHKGFDFRHLIRFIKSKNWRVKTLGYSPLPLKCWYGNSQIFFSIERYSLNSSPK